MAKKLLAGWGESDITPDQQTVELSGQYYQRMSQGVHSRLKTVALVLEQDTTRTIMVSLDCVGVPEDYVRRLEQAIARQLPDLADAQLIVHATHIHSAPSLERTFNWWEPNPDALTCEAYQDIVERQLIQAVAAAWSSRQPCGIANVLDFARIGHCRRASYADHTAEMYGHTDRADFMGMEGGEDSGVDLLFFFDARKQPMGVIVNVACPSQVMEATYRVSSDFMGALREKLKVAYGAGFMTLCQVSAAGDQSPRDLTRNYKGEPDFWHADGVEVLSDRLLAAVKRALPRAAGALECHPLFCSQRTRLSLPRRRVSKSEHLAAQKELARLDAIQDSAAAYRDFCDEVRRNERIASRPGPYDSKLHHFVLIRNQEAVVRRYKDQDANPDFEMRLGVVRIGDTVFATNPFELYLEFGQRIKARSPAAQTFVIQLANGIGGYLPTRRAEELGGYGGLVINGEVGSDGGRKLVNETLAAISRLWS